MQTTSRVAIGTVTTLGLMVGVLAVQPLFVEPGDASPFLVGALAVAFLGGVVIGPWAIASVPGVIIAVAIVGNLVGALTGSESGECVNCRTDELGPWPIFFGMIAVIVAVVTALGVLTGMQVRKMWMARKRNETAGHG